MKQTLDPASIGVSFVDLLFALAVTQVFAPVANWAEDPVKHSLPLSSWMQLGVALTITVTSWIGYHASANKARFQVQFVNVELLKLVLDVAMVAVYFMLAAYAVRKPATLRPQTLLVLGAFVLYACWDLASAYQKRDGDDNEYRKEWEGVRGDDTRTDVKKAWSPTDWGRILATWISLTLILAAWAIIWFAAGRLTTTWSVMTQCGLLILVVLYRFLKEWLAFYRGIPEEKQGAVKPMTQFRLLFSPPTIRQAVPEPTEAR